MPRADEHPPQFSGDDPEALARQLEIELQLKRASWQQARARRGLWRALSLIFLLLVVFGALAVFFVLQPRLHRAAPENARPGESERVR